MVVIWWWWVFFLVNVTCFFFLNDFKTFSLSDWNDQSAEDVIAEQAKQEEEDPFVNLSKKEKKKKKKQVNTLYGAHEIMQAGCTRKDF